MILCWFLVCELHNLSMDMSTLPSTYRNQQKASGLWCMMCIQIFASEVFEGPKYHPAESRLAPCDIWNYLKKLSATYRQTRFWKMTLDKVLEASRTNLPTHPFPSMTSKSYLIKFSKSQLNGSKIGFLHLFDFQDRFIRIKIHDFSFDATICAMKRFFAIPQDEFQTVLGFRS